MSQVNIKYGEKDEYEVEFRLDDESKLVARYVGEAGAWVSEPFRIWEERERVPENASLLDAIRSLLEGYAWPV